MMTLVLAVALVVLAAFFVLKPLFGAKLGISSGSGGHLQQLLDQRETISNGLRELENDRALGNLGEPEYLRLRDDYDGQLAAVLRALATRINGLADDLEAEIAQERRRGG